MDFDVTATITGEVLAVKCLFFELPEDAQRLMFGKASWRVAHFFHLMKYQLPLVLHGFLEHEALMPLVNAIQTQREKLQLPQEKVLTNETYFQNQWNYCLALLLLRVKKFNFQNEAAKIKSLALLINPDTINSQNHFGGHNIHQFDLISPILREMIDFMNDSFKKSAYQNLAFRASRKNEIFLRNRFKNESNQLRRIDILSGLMRYQSLDTHRLLLDYYQKNSDNLQPQEFNAILINMNSPRTLNLNPQIAWRGLSQINTSFGRGAYDVLRFHLKISDKTIVNRLLSLLDDDSQIDNFSIHLSQFRVINNVKAYPSIEKLLQLYLKGYQLPQKTDNQRSIVSALKKVYKPSLGTRKK